ncbi:hypothetical protein HKX48_001436 [Thoreauomyces humboldtii]|nr:hypothetical protein HKX48_001436 [Thoreauomyces humboldtii]
MSGCDDVIANITEAVHLNFTVQLEQLWDECAANTTAALLAQAIDTSYNVWEVGMMSALVIHVFIMALLGDRITSLQHKPTLITFLVAIGLTLTETAWGILCNVPSLTFFFGYKGTQLYFYVDAVLSSSAEWCASVLLYLRVSPSIVHQYGKRAEMAGYAAVFVVLILELLKELDACITYTITADYEVNVYDDRLVFLSFAYRTTLDVLLCGYSLWIVHRASRGSKAGQGSFLRDDRAVLVAYTIRLILFLGGDVVWYCSHMLAPSDSDISMGADAVWVLNRVIVPWKLYLVITDVARVRSLSQTTAERYASSMLVKGSSEPPRSSIKSAAYDDNLVEELPGTMSDLEKK